MTSAPDPGISGAVISLTLISLTVLLGANYAAAPHQGPALQDVYITVRADGASGSGKQSDPYDGSTAEKFDAVMDNVPRGTTVQLAKGAVFRTNGLKWPDNSKGWAVKDGLHISGNGATIQLVSYPNSWTGTTSQKHVVIGNRYYERPVNDVIIENLTIDADWQNLSCPWTNKAVMCSFLYGSNNTYRQVRAINMYGDGASRTECFCLGFNAPNAVGGASNCVAEECLLQSPRGDYQAGILFSGWNDQRAVPDQSKLMKRCRAVRNRILGRFESGGVNLAFVSDVLISDNYFNNSQGVHHDTGTADKIVITNNMLNQIYGFGVDFEPMPNVNRCDITIRENTFRMPQSVMGAHTYGINMASCGRSFRNVVIQQNSFIKEVTGEGSSLWRALHLHGLQHAIISDNKGDTGMEYIVEGTEISIRNNRDFTGVGLAALSEK
jgi:hypothetical protein